jgi:hypothetical protein
MLLNRADWSPAEDPGKERTLEATVTFRLEADSMDVSLVIASGSSNCYYADRAEFGSTEIGQTPAAFGEENP